MLHTVSWWGNACTSAANHTSSTITQGYVTAEDAMSYYNQVHCPAGKVLNGAATGSADKFVCSNIWQTNSGQRSNPDSEAVRGKELRCETGQMVNGGTNGGVTTMHTGATTRLTGAH